MHVSNQEILLTVIAQEGSQDHLTIKHPILATYGRQPSFDKIYSSRLPQDPMWPNILD